MNAENFPSNADLVKDCLKIPEEPPYSFCFLDETGVVTLLLSEKSILFLFLEAEVEIAKRFNKKSCGRYDCIITAN